MIDDEPEHLDWLVDYMDAKDFKTTTAINVRDAIEAIEKTTYRAYIVDLNIPLGGWIPSVNAGSASYSDYYGLFALKLIRSQGNAGARVLAYSAHSNGQIIAEVNRLYCRYIAKGRPREFKAEMERLLSRDPKMGA